MHMQSEQFKEKIRHLWIVKKKKYIQSMSENKISPGILPADNYY